MPHSLSRKAGRTHSCSDSPSSGSQSSERAISSATPAHAAIGDRDGLAPQCSSSASAIRPPATMTSARFGSMPGTARRASRSRRRQTVDDRGRARRAPSRGRGRAPRRRAIRPSDTAASVVIVPAMPTGGDAGRQRRHLRERLARRGATASASSAGGSCVCRSVRRTLPTSKLSANVMRGRARPRCPMTTSVLPPPMSKTRERPAASPRQSAQRAAERQPRLLLAADDARVDAEQRPARARAAPRRRAASRIALVPTTAMRSTAQLADDRARSRRGRRACARSPPASSARVRSTPSPSRVMVARSSTAAQAHRSRRAPRPAAARCWCRCRSSRRA